MIWLDALDQAIYRGLVGRGVNAIDKQVDQSSVFSPRLSQRPSVWRLKKWDSLVAERRHRGLEMLDSHPVLGVIDIQDFYPSVELELVNRSLRLPYVTVGPSSR